MKLVICKVFIEFLLVDEVINGLQICMQIYIFVNATRNNETYKKTYVDF